MNKFYRAASLILLVLCVAFSIPVSAQQQQAHGTPTDFTDAELADLTGFYVSEEPAAQVPYWKSLMPASPEPAKTRSDVLKALPVSWIKHRLDAPDIVRHIQATIRPVTELFGKNYEVMIIEYNKPVLIIDSDTLLIITTELIEALHSDDELQGLVGHEIAHSIFNERGREIKERVKKSGDPSAIHALAVIELSCDAIVARTLLLLGRDPRAFVRLIESLERNYAKDGESYHPAAEVRRKFVEGITPSTPVKAQQSAAFKALKSSLFLTRNH